MPDRAPVHGGDHRLPRESGGAQPTRHGQGPMTPAVFVDRDRALIEEVGYLDNVDRLALFPWSVDAVRLLNDAGFKVVVVSNQAGVARGFFRETFVRDVQRILDGLLAAGGARVDGWYYCPHHPDAPLAQYRQ